MLFDLNHKGKEDEITAEMTAKVNHVGNLPEKDSIGSFDSK